jgi:undecaprenyl-diphosphatase
MAANGSSTPGLPGFGARIPWAWLNQLDESALVGIRRWRSGRVDMLMKALTMAGNTSSWFLHGLILLAVGGEHAMRYVGLLAVAATTATAASQLLKRSVRRPRPNRSIEAFVPVMENPDAFSFPSGHTAVSFAVATALTCAYGPLGAAELAFAVGIGTSRVYLGAHYPLDVGAGALLGMVCGLAAVLLTGTAL